MLKKIPKRIANALNNMNPKQLIILAGIAFVLMFAVLAAGLNHIANEKSDKQVAEAPPPVEQKVSVVVAKINIAPGTHIKEEMLQMKEISADAVPGDAIQNFERLKDVQLKIPVFAGDVITESKIAAPVVDEGFAGSIPPNCRAISINVNDVTGVAGFAKPGDRVDLLLVEKGKNSVTTQILLQNVPLLSINQDRGTSSPVGENGVPTGPITNPSIVTFALPPEDALKVISASKLGEIYLSLRPSKPQSNYVEPMEYTMESADAPKRESVRESVRETAPVIPSAPVPQVPMTPPTPKIEIIAGDQVVQRSSSSAPQIYVPSSAPSSAPTTSQPLPVIPSTPVPSPPIVQPEN